MAVMNGSLCKYQITKSDTSSDWLVGTNDTLPVFVTATHNWSKHRYTWLAEHVNLRAMFCTTWLFYSKRKLIFKALLLVLFTRSISLINAKRQLYIGCISPLTGSYKWWGRGISVAAEMAFEMINNDTNIIRDHEIILIKNNSKGQTGLGNKILYEYLNKKQVLMILGPARSNVAISVADTAKYWNLIQISASASSGDLSNSRKYPYFMRTVPSSSSMRTSFVALAKKFGWKRVSILFYYRAMQVQAATDLKAECEANNITVLSFGSYANNDDASTQIKHIKDIDSRIIFGFLQLTTSVMCKVFQHKMFGRQYAWIIHTPDKIGWWNRTYRRTKCTIDDVSQAAQHVITINDMTISRQNKTGISGLTPHEFRLRYKKYAKDRNTITSIYGAFAFDAAWLIALALNKTIGTLEPLQRNQQYYIDKTAALTIKKTLLKTTFFGVTDFVHLDKNGDRYGHFDISQIQDNKLRLVGQHDVFTNKVTLEPGSNFTWRGGYPPSDHLIVYPRLVVFPVNGFIVICCLVTAGIILSFVFLYCNIAYRHKKFIKMSSPNINNLIIAGCIAAYISVILFAIDGEHLTSLVCEARVFTLNIGFTLAFGAMFSKTWRVHRITRKLRTKRRLLKDVHLFGMVMTFLVIDVMILVTWFFVSPIEKGYRWFDVKPTNPTNADVIYRKRIVFCKMNDVILRYIVMYGTKSLLLVFGLFLAWETRTVKISALNDSQNTGMAVYNVVVICFIGVPIIKLLNDELYQAIFIITTFCIMSCTTLTLCLVFVPKVRRIINCTADELTTLKDNISLKTRLDSKGCGCGCHKELPTDGTPKSLQNKDVHTARERPDVSSANICNIETKPSYVI